MKLVKMIAAGMVVGTVGMSAMGVSADEIRDGQTEAEVTVATGSRFENTVGLNASLDVPKDVTAATYTTQLEWTLKPAE
ncbi:hypothetical protein Q5427_08290 [Brochothrix thermosphacta]|uniref:hypothetical protein n=1 Tax=Brochothrix thermosphacta TaxID=2756 RepID=UPI002713CC53|nr:hypothetical protein [Brochothrix thermosphacta]MDO7864293.1 hypothetical protein [Brochothrix thermosphacta]